MHFERHFTNSFEDCQEMELVPKTIHMSCWPCFVLSLVVFLESYLSGHVQPMESCSSFNKWPVKHVPVVGSKYMWFHLQNMVKESF